MGMGKLFGLGIDLIYDTQTAKVRTEGFLSQSFVIQRGVKQGCLLPFFNLVIEALAVRQNV